MKKAIFLAFLFFGVLSSAWAQGLVVEKPKGDVQVLKKGTSDWVQAQQGMPLESGDKVKTGEKSSVSIHWEKGTIELAEKTDFSVTEHAAKDDQIKTSLELTLGKLKAKVDKLNQGSEFKVTTPTSVAAVRGTFFGLWVYDYLGDLFSRLDVWDGIVNFGDKDSDENFDVKGGQFATGGEEGITKPKDEEGEGGQEGEGENPLDDKDATGTDPFDAQDGFQQDSSGSQDNNGNFPDEQPEEPEKEKSPNDGKDDTPRDDEPPSCTGPKC